MNRGERIQLLYAGGLIVWLIIIISMELYMTTWLGWLLLLIPIIVFIIGMMNSHYLDPQVEAEMFEADFLSIGLLVVLPLLTWVTKDYEGDRKHFLSLVVVAIILTMLSMVDIWVSIDDLYLIKHCKSILQTMSIGLLIFALYTYYVNSNPAKAPLISENR